MPWVSKGRAALVAAAVACLAYAGALGNGWALDDHPVIERNPAAHSPRAALVAAFSPYWPPEDGLSAGLWRPLTVLTYGIDWVLSGGRPWWFHLVNLLLHGAITGLVVLVVAAWLPSAAALIAGVVFAVHPVHTEAVANVVGRAELLAALGLLGAVLAARRFRRSRARRLWFAVAVAAAAAAQLSKEHGVVAVGLVGLDHVLERDRAGEAPRPSSVGLYLALATVTLGYLHLWNAVTGDFVAAAAAVPLRELSTTERLAAVFPVQLEVVRLLVWPWDLAPEYGPQTIPIRGRWSWAATLGATVAAAIVVLAVLVRRRAPAVAFGVLAGVLTYAATSNLLFVSGVILAERALYLAALAPAVVHGWLAERAAPPHVRVAVAGVVLVSGAFTVRTVTRVPFWRDTRTVVVEGFIYHPESFSAQVRLAQARERLGDVQGAIAQYLAATAIYDGYSFVPVRAAQLALASGRPTLARELAAVAAARDPTHPAVARLRARVLLQAGHRDSSLVVLRAAIDARPLNVAALEYYVQALDSLPAPAWQRHLAAARLEWRRGHPIAATRWLDAARPVLPPVPRSAEDCWELAATRLLARTLHIQVHDAMDRTMAAGAPLYGLCRVAVE
jgi:hypothetical protein